MSRIPRAIQKAMVQYGMFEIDLSISPPSCLPADVDRSKLVDITVLNDEWRVYVNPVTHKVYDGAKYHVLVKRMRERLKQKGVSDPLEDGPVVGCRD